MTKHNPLRALEGYGQSIWLDFIGRGIIESGKLQRLLWASTSTKNPEYSDVKYVEVLIGPYTINTIPMATLDAYRDHGKPQPRLLEGPHQAREALEKLAGLGISLDDVTQRLETEGIEKFNKPYDKLLETLERKRQTAMGQAEPAYAV